MDDQAGSSRQPSRKPPRRRRIPRPEGRWTNPASPLQAARFERRRSGKEIVAAIRAICPGHTGEPCKLDVAKLSDYETGNRRPGLTHIEAFCRYYQRSPEDLGLIKWRDDHDEAGGTNGDGPGRSAHQVRDQLSDGHTLEGALEQSLQAASTLLAGLSAADLPLDDDGVTVDRVLLDLVAGTVALTAVATQVLRANLADGHASGHVTTGAIV